MGLSQGRWSGTEKVAQAGRRELWGSALALLLAAWPQTGTCPSLGLSPPRSAVFKLGGRALEFRRGAPGPVRPGVSRGTLSCLLLEGWSTVNVVFLPLADIFNYSLSAKHRSQFLLVLLVRQTRKLRHRKIKWLVRGCLAERTELGFECAQSGSRTCGFRGLLRVPGYSLPPLSPHGPQVCPPSPRAHCLLQL